MTYRLRLTCEGLKTWLHESMVKLKPSFFFNSKPEALEAAIQLVFPNVNVPRFPLLTVFDWEEERTVEGGGALAAIWWSWVSGCMELWWHFIIQSSSITRCNLTKTQQHNPSIHTPLSWKWACVNVIAMKSFPVPFQAQTFPLVSSFYSSTCTFSCSKMIKSCQSCFRFLSHATSCHPPSMLPISYQKS